MLEDDVRKIHPLRKGQPTDKQMVVMACLEKVVTLEIYLGHPVGTVLVRKLGRMRVTSQVRTLTRRGWIRPKHRQDYHGLLEITPEGQGAFWSSAWAVSRS